MDVEGYEPLVIQGAKRTLSALPPRAILAEYSPGVIEADGAQARGHVSRLCARVDTCHRPRQADTCQHPSHADTCHCAQSSFRGAWRYPASLSNLLSAGYHMWQARVATA